MSNTNPVKKKRMVIGITGKLKKNVVEHSKCHKIIGKFRFWSMFQMETNEISIKSNQITANLINT